MTTDRYSINTLMSGDNTLMTSVTTIAGATSHAWLQTVTYGKPG